MIECTTAIEEAILCLCRRIAILHSTTYSIPVACHSNDYAIGPSCNNINSGIIFSVLICCSSSQCRFLVPDHIAYTCLVLASPVTGYIDIAPRCKYCSVYLSITAVASLCIYTFGPRKCGRAEYSKCVRLGGTC